MIKIQCDGCGGIMSEGEKHIAVTLYESGSGHDYEYGLPPDDEPHPLLKGGNHWHFCSPTCIAIEFEKYARGEYR